jgi:hypothetical protein
VPGVYSLQYESDCLPGWACDLPVTGDGAPGAAGGAGPQPAPDPGDAAMGGGRQWQAMSLRPVTTAQSEPLAP